MTPQERKVRNARAQIVHAHPFFGVLLLKQRVVETDNVATMATDGTTLYFNAGFVEELPMPQLRAVCAHEALHPAFCHHTRRGDRDHELWNMACDYVINPVLIDAGLKLPDSALLRDDLRGLNAEQAYARLIAERNASGRDQDDDRKQDDETHDAQGSASPDDAGDAENQPDDEGTTQPKNSEPVDPDTEGDSVVADYGGTGAILDAPVVTPEERADEEREWRITLSEAAQAQAMHAGSLSGDIKRLIDATLEPQADWRDLLRRFMDQFAKSDYSWQRQDRRYVSRGTYLPALHTETMGPIALVIDASGSMPDDLLQQVGSEVQAICDELQPQQVDVIVHDTEIRSIESFEPGDAIALEVRAGGGTSYEDVATWLAANDDYVCAVWFTDLHCYEYGNEPDVPIVWLDYSNGDRVPEYGDDVVRMPR